MLVSAECFIDGVAIQRCTPPPPPPPQSRGEKVFPDFQFLTLDCPDDGFLGLSLFALDSRHLRTVTHEEAMEFAKKHNLAFLEVRRVLS